MCQYTFPGSTDTASSGITVTTAAQEPDPIEVQRGRLLARVYVAAYAIALEIDPAEPRDAHFAAMKAMELAASA